MVLIHRNHQILLARSPHFAPGKFSALAGFVEPGETLEEACHREVKEEVNVAIKNLHYFGSQPWPFPHSLMIAFHAEYAGGEIEIDNKEIVEAGWFGKDNLPDLPAPVSIARRLIEDGVR
jgi:NAD+ diphosphatase